jgi:citrate synthase
VSRDDSRYVTPAEAAGALGVTLPTLYAYASRGQLRSEPVPGQPRQRRYHRADVERLQQRQQSRRDPDAAAARGLHWGGPVLESGITLIDEGRVYFRGCDAVELAGTASLEQVAALLWAADGIEREHLFTQPAVLPPRHLAQLRTCTPDPFRQLQIALMVAATVDTAAHDLRPAAVRYTGARIIRLLTAVISRNPRPPSVAHRALHDAWAPKVAGAGGAIRTALVLCADHELNVSAFTARCAASAAASPYDAVSAAMATLKGDKHGGASQRVLELMVEAATPARARAAIASRIRRGERVPGFGHPLYPAGDPRAAVMLQLAHASGNRPASRVIRHFCQAGSELLHDAPNLDFGLAALTHAFALPPAAPLLLFALGRTAGWIAHAMEEYASGELIRPRARYVGPAIDRSSRER